MGKILDDQVKKQVGYSESSRNCSACKFCSLDYSTDNFGSGDQCVRNPDFPFKVNAQVGWCNRFESSKDESKE